MSSAFIPLSGTETHANHFLSHHDKHDDTCQMEHFPPESLYLPIFLSFHEF